MYKTFDSYKQYLKENKDKFPESVYEFASDVERHDINSPHSLHDAWMTSITIAENRNEKAPFEPKPSILIKLLGQMHDREIMLEYRDVESYVIEGIKNKFNYADTFQGDISYHEVTINDRGKVVHEILFASDSKIIIECSAFECRENVHE